MKLLLAALCLPGVLCADSPVSISILSVLRPAELTITLLQPERAVFRANASQSVLLSNTSVNVKLTKARLVVDSMSFSEFSISCAPLCTTELNVPGKMVRRYNGNLQLSIYSGAINIVLHTSQEELITSISASEMGEFQEEEALSAFAIISRGFLQAGRRHPELGADFCDLTHCQVFQSYAPSPEALKAVKETNGLILTYQRKPFRPYYFRSCGGRTATFEEVWRKESPDYPFISVNCPCDSTWEARLDGSQLQAITGFPFLKVQQEGNQVHLSSENRQVTYSLEEFRNAVGRMFGWNRIKSNFFTTSQRGIELLVAGKGIGHRVGFCQNGAFHMAKSGKSFQEILQHYFPNAEIRAAR